MPRVDSDRARTNRYAGSGSGLPLRVTWVGASNSKPVLVAACVRSPTRIVPGSATCSSRAATFTASPATMRWFGVSPIGATTSPVLTPVRISSVTLWSRASCSFSSTSRCRISRAACSARDASSSRTLGTPKTAITASPMNFSTEPPQASTTADMVRK